MNKDELKGKAQRLKGRLKEAVGVLMGRTDKRAEGMADQVKGTAREKFGDIQDLSSHGQHKLDDR